jgi:carbamoyl-phosphate synthase large subunit
MEHLERAGVHSGDSISVYPTISIKPKTIKQIIEYTEKLAKALNVLGMVNIQYVLYNEELYVIELIQDRAVQYRI